MGDGGWGCGRYLTNATITIRSVFRSRRRVCNGVSVAVVYSVKNRSLGISRKVAMI